MKTARQYAAFLSFAEPDRPLALALHELFKSLGEQTYYAPERVPETWSLDWIERIMEGLKHSACFIPIYTRHSLDRRWVLYESGAARVLGILPLPARVSGVSVEDIRRRGAPGDYFIYDLFREESLAKLVNLVRARGGKIGPKLRSNTKTALHDNPWVLKVTKYSGARWIFVAGNVPRGHYRKKGPLLDYDAKKYESRLRGFVERLTFALLNGGFNIASCPQVPAVGGAVAHAATHWLHAHSSADPDRYQIGGLFPIDKFLRESRMSRPLRDQMHKYLIDFRQSYLRDKEWLIIVGGSDGTAEEYVEAKKLGLNLFAIPCFGGASWEAFKGMSQDLQGPCRGCNNFRDCDPNRIVEHLLGS